MKIKKEIKELLSYYTHKYNVIIVSNNYSYCYLDEDNIYLNISVLQNPTIDNVFEFLHEVGHLETNTTKMKRCMQEYLATQWAIDEYQKYGIKPSKETIDIYQEYIYGWRERYISRSKTMPSKNEITLSLYKGDKNAR